MGRPMCYILTLFLRGFSKGKRTLLAFVIRPLSRFSRWFKMHQALRPSRAPPVESVEGEQKFADGFLRSGGLEGGWREIVPQRQLQQFRNGDVDTVQLLYWCSCTSMPYICSSLLTTMWNIRLGRVSQTFIQYLTICFFEEESLSQTKRDRTFTRWRQ